MTFPAARTCIALVTAAATAAALAGCTSTHSPDPRQQAASAFLTALGRRDASAAAAATSDPSAAAAIMTATAGLGTGAKGTFRVGAVHGSGSTATAAYTASWAVPGAGRPWAYAGALPLAKQSGHWRVRWEVADVQPQLRPGERLLVQRTQPQRAALQDAAGSPLFTEQPVVTVGVNPAWVKDLTALAAALASALGVSAADIVSSVQAAPKGQFVPVITLRQAAYEQVKARIHDLAGTEFQSSTQLLGPSSTFAQPLLGRVGPATQELIADSHGRIAASDQTGLSGLQLALDAQLAGTDGVGVYAAGADGAQPRSLAVLSAPRPGTPVRLTIDRSVQTAAEATLAAVGAPATIVVTQPSSGKILAVASTPSAAAMGDLALTGQLPPGSTFKIVTYTAAFAAHSTLTPQSRMPCPGTMTVNGQTVRKENDFVLGTVPLSSAFAFSCNTTAAKLGLELPAGALRSAAQQLGLGTKWTLPVDAFSGSLPEPSGPSERNMRAADAYGQGQVLVSPLLMAEIAGAAATGRSVAPSLVDGKQATPGAPFPAKITGYLNTLMRDVVTVPGATGRDLAGLPGQVEGKTPTAEYGTAQPAKTHSWFAGVRGDLAFSVFVYGGGSSMTGAVPLARTLLTRLP